MLAATALLLIMVVIVSIEAGFVVSLIVLADDGHPFQLCWLLPLPCRVAASDTQTLNPKPSSGVQQHWARPVKAEHSGRVEARLSKPNTLNLNAKHISESTHFHPCYFFSGLL